MRIFDNVEFFLIKQLGAIVEHEVKGRYILVISNIYCPLFFMTFYNLGLDNKF
ncbi:hypothetical protein bcgnr5410_56960 [Bacillus cereus]